MGKPFKVDGYEIMFPGDTGAPAYLVYNCRCTLIAAVEGVDTSDAQRRARDPKTGETELVSDMSYQEWVAQKEVENKAAWDVYTKKGKNLSSDCEQWQEYREVLGNKAPNTIEEFQDLKYNEPDQWSMLKTTKRQTVFVNNAPCETTKKKYSGYFLKEGAKHADLDVGYTAGDVLQLRYDVAKQFDMSKAVEFRDRDSGARTFNIYMELGVTKKRSFVTSWIEDAPGATPRIITAFRKNREDNDD